MSDTSSLTDLARFSGQTDLSAHDRAVRRQALATLTRGLETPRHRRKVGELLAAVLALSARTRRMVLPQVDIDLDVFAPDGARAVRLVYKR